MALEPHGRSVVIFLVVVNAEFFEQRVGFGQGGEGLGGEERRAAFLPEVVGALDLAFGLRGGRVTQRDFVEAQGRTELGQSVRRAGEIEGVIVDVEREGEAVGEEDSGQEIEMGGEILAFVKPRAGDAAAVKSR